MKQSTLLLAFVLLAAVARAQESHTRSDLELRHRAEIARTYAKTAWPVGSLREGLPVEAPLAGFAAGALVVEDELLVRTYSFAAPELGGPVGSSAFVLEARVADSVAAAQEAVVDWLAGLQSPARMPSLGELGLAVGDAGFAGRSGARQGGLAWIAFVRGNVAVRVSAFDLTATPELELAPVAAALDRGILATRTLPAGEKPLRPALARLDVARRAVAGARLALDLDADPSAILSWRVGGSGQGYVERGADGRWWLHPTGPGPLTVTLEAVSALGTVARRSVELAVEDD